MFVPRCRAVEAVFFFEFLTLLLLLETLPFDVVCVRTLDGWGGTFALHLLASSHSSSFFEASSSLSCISLRFCRMHHMPSSHVEAHERK